VGKHDGVVKGERYFQTKPNHAVFTKYGQTNPVGGAPPAAAAKKVGAASTSASASAKKVSPKPTSGQSSMPPSNPASSQVSSATNSAAPSPPNEPEDFYDDASMSHSDLSMDEIPISSTPTPQDASSDEPHLQSAVPPTHDVSPADTLVSPSPAHQEPPRSTSPAIVPPQVAKAEEPVRALSPPPKPAPTHSPSKIPAPTAKQSTTALLSSPSKLPKPQHKPEPVASSSIEVEHVHDDDGESAYESERRLQEIVQQLEKAEEERDALKLANLRLENQVSILKEGSESIIAQQQAGGAAREALEADLRGQIRELKSKLEASSERCSELEKRTRDLDHQLATSAKSHTENVATAIQKATADLTAALNKLKAETEEKIESLSTDLEMVAMDKEIAEEERDSAMKDLEQLKLQNELLESYKQQAEQVGAETIRRASLGPSTTTTADVTGTSGAAMVADVLSSPEYVALNTQHERLKEALVKLKDMAVEEKQAHDKAQREIEQYTLRTIPSLEEKMLKLQEQCVDYEEQIEILKANIDDAAELQEKYSDLFEKKLDVEEENKGLRSALKELEAIRDLSDQLEEEQQAAESRLKAELYAKQVEILDRETAIKNAKDQLESQTNMIERLQNLLAEQRTAASELDKKLQVALKNRRRRGAARRALIDLQDGEMAADELEEDGAWYDDEEDDQQLLEDSDGGGALGISHSSSTASMRSLQQKDTELQIMLQKQAARAAANALVEKLRELERQQAVEQLALFQTFVPESYIRVDSEAIKCLLLNKRLMEKANIIVHYLQEQYHLERFERSAVIQEDSSTITPLTTTEELAYFAWKLAASVTRLGNNAAIFAESFKSADSDTYTRFARLHIELSPCEKKLDHLISLLQQDELTVAFSLQDLEVLLDSFDQIALQYCQLTALPASQHYSRLGSELIFASRGCFFELIALKSTLNQLAQAASLPSLGTSLDLISQTIMKYLVDGSRKLRRSAEGRPALAYHGTTLNQLRATVKLATSLHSLFSSLRHRVTAAGDRIDDAIVTEIGESLVAQCDLLVNDCLSELPPSDATSGRLTKHYDVAVTSALKMLFTLDEEIERGAHDALTSEVAKPTERLVNGVVVFNVSQLNARAAILLEEVAAAAGLKGELSGLQRELRDRETALGYKSKEIEDLEFRLKKQDHRLQVLEKVETDAKEELSQHQKNYASQVMNLETANRELLEQVEQAEVEREEARTSAATSALRVASLEEQLAMTMQKQQQSISLDSATTQISSLRSAVKHLNAKVSRLRAQESLKLLENKLPPLAIIVSHLSKPKPSVTEVEGANSIESSSSPTSAAPPEPSLLKQDTHHTKTFYAITDLTVTTSTSAASAYKLVESAYSLSTCPTIVDLTRVDSSPASQLESLQFEAIRLKAAIIQESRQTLQALAHAQHATSSSHFSSFPTTSFVASVNATARGPLTAGRITLSNVEKVSLFSPSVPNTLHVTPSELCSIHNLLVK